LACFSHIIQEEKSKRKPICIGLCISIALPIIIFALIIPGINQSNQEITEDANPLIDFDIPSLFKLSIHEKLFNISNNKISFFNVQYELNPGMEDVYSQIGFFEEEQNTIIIYPVFTASAYESPGFYDYYTEECDTSCLTTDFTSTLYPEASENAIKIFNLLGYKFVSDIDIELHPEKLAKYDKVIVLHNEYVTKNEFEAITNHPNVIYLFPNALYAEVKMNHEDNTITLVRGHGYPTPEISNGFDWEFDNSKFEYDIECNNWQFYEVDNGVMLDCWPDLVLHNDFELLKFIKEY